MHHPMINRDNTSGLAEMMRAIDDDRFIVIEIPESAIVAMFNVAFDAPASVIVPVFPKLPAGYLVMGCLPNFMSRTVSLKVFHPIFDPYDNSKIQVLRFEMPSSIQVPFAKLDVNGNDVAAKVKEYFATQNQPRG